jgi:pectin methylesterase-like acyl-CoA thioesterase
MSQANTTNPTELDDLLRGRIHLSGNGIGDGSVIQGKTVTRMVLSDGLSANILRNVATLTSSGSGSGIDVPAISNALIVNPATIAGSPTRNGTLQLPFQTPADAVAYALAHAMVLPVIAIAPGSYPGNLTIPEQLHGVDFVSLIPSDGTNYPATILGDVALVSYGGSSRLGLHGVSLTGNVTCANAASAPAHVTIVATDCTITGSVSGSSVTIGASHTTIFDGPITASSGAVALVVDRYTRKSLTSLTITPTPSITLADGPLTVAQGGDPGEGGSSVGDSPIANVLIVDGVNYASSGANGSRAKPFRYPNDAINAAVALGSLRPVIALAPGTYTGEIAVPEQIRHLVLTELVHGTVGSTSSDTTVSIVGDISCTSYQGVSRVDLNRIFLTGNIISRNPAAAPAQLNLSVRECQIVGNLTASQIVVYGHRTKFVTSTIVASSGYVALDLDRFTHRGILASGASVAISPAPTVTLYDGPLTVAQGGDPGSSYNGTLAADATKQVFNFTDGRRVWKYERYYCVTLVNGVTNSSVVITESEHGGDGQAVYNPGTDISHPIAHVTVEFFGALPTPTEPTTPGGFSRMTWEGALDKDSSSGVWVKREELSIVQPCWDTLQDMGKVVATMSLSGTANRTITLNLSFDGPSSPPPYSLVKVLIQGTGKFVV